MRYLLSAGGPADQAEVRETHMSWVVLTRDRVLKLKKPVRYPYLDFATVRAREQACRDELRLNRRLAPDVYLDVAALRWCDGALTLTPADHRPPQTGTIDWVVVMRRLPDDRMLDRMIASGTLEVGDVDAVTAVLMDFYRRAPRVPVTGAEYRARLAREQDVNRRVLADTRFALPEAPHVLDAFDRALARHGDLVEARAEGGRLVDGHGDLRPEHVCLLTPPVVIDCLEFNAQLRQVDPLDELALLGLECALLGAGWVGPRMQAAYAAGCGDTSPPGLSDLYTAYRAVLRARLTVAHLADPHPRTPDRWPPLARRYLRHASAALDRLATSAAGVGQRIQER